MERLMWYTIFLIFSKAHLSGCWRVIWKDQEKKPISFLSIGKSQHYMNSYLNYNTRTRMNEIHGKETEMSKKWVDNKEDQHNV